MLSIVSRERDCLDLVYRWFYKICTHFLRVDNSQITIAALGDISGGEQWWKTLPMDRTLNGSPNCPLFVKEEMANHEVIY